MKRIFFSLMAIIGFLSFGCAGQFKSSQALLKREPAAVTNAKVTSQTTKPVDKYLRYLLIRDKGFANVDKQDCKAYAQKSPTLCKSDDCKAILFEQEFRCKESNCKALILNREELCTDDACKALVNYQTEKCKHGDKICQSIINNESAACDNADCKALIESNGFTCTSMQCKAIVNENINFCDLKPAQ